MHSLNKFLFCFALLVSSAYSHYINSDGLTSAAGNSKSKSAPLNSAPELRLSEGFPKEEGKRQDGNEVDLGHGEEQQQAAISSEDFHEMELMRSRNCPGIRCLAAPAGAKCKESVSIKLNPVMPMLGSKSDCCPIHVCVRKDGSQFTHYGLQGEGVQATSGSYATGTGVNNFPLPSDFQDFQQLPNPAPMFQRHSKQRPNSHHGQVSKQRAKSSHGLSQQRPKAKHGQASRLSPFKVDTGFWGSTRFNKKTPSPFSSADAEFFQKKDRFQDRDQRGSRQGAASDYNGDDAFPYHF